MIPSCGKEGTVDTGSYFMKKNHVVSSYETHVPLPLMDHLLFIRIVYPAVCRQLGSRNQFIWVMNQH